MRYKDIQIDIFEDYFVKIFSFNSIYLLRFLVKIIYVLA